MSKVNAILFHVLFVAVVFSLSCNKEVNAKEPNGIHPNEAPFGWWVQTGPLNTPPRNYNEVKLAMESGASWTIIDPIDRDFRKNYNSKGFASRQYYDHIQFLKEKNIDIVQQLEYESLTQTRLIDRESPELNLPNDLVQYFNDLKDYVATYKSAIQYWMPRLEMTTNWRASHPNIDEKTLTLIVQDLAILCRIHYKAIKEADPEAKIILGAFWYPHWFAGLDNPIGRTKKRNIAIEFLKELEYLENIEKGKTKDTKYISHPDLDSREYAILISKDNYSQYFDIIGNSYQSGRVEYEPYTKRFPRLLADNGYPGIPIWMQDNYPVNVKKVSQPQYSYGMFGDFLDGLLTELEAARQMMSRILVGLPYVERVTLNYFMMASVAPSHCKDKDYECGYKRLGFYAYKKLIEKLNGFTSIEKLVSRKNGGLYIRVYKYTFKSKKPIWIAFQTLPDQSWGNPLISFSPTTIVLDVGDINEVKITQAIPKYKTGQEVKDYSTAFEIESKRATNGKVTILLGENPIFVEKEH